MVQENSKKEIRQENLLFENSVNTLTWDVDRERYASDIQLVKDLFYDKDIVTLQKLLHETGLKGRDRDTSPYTLDRAQLLNGLAHAALARLGEDPGQDEAYKYECQFGQSSEEVKMVERFRRDYGASAALKLMQAQQARKDQQNDRSKEA